MLRTFVVASVFAVAACGGANSQIELKGGDPDLAQLTGTWARVRYSIGCLKRSSPWEAWWAATKPALVPPANDACAASQPWGGSGTHMLPSVAA